MRVWFDLSVRAGWFASSPIVILVVFGVLLQESYYVE